MKSTAEQIAFYSQRLKEWGPTPHGVGWAADGITQWIRFDVLYKLAGVRSDDTILDAGCGVGHFVDPYMEWSRGSGMDRYIGVDRHPEMIRLASERRPAYRFVCSDLLDWKEPADVVVANGVFAFGTLEDAQRLIRHLFSLAHRVLVFNVLTEWGPRATSDLVWSPIALLQFCATLTQNLVFRHDYLPADATVGMWKPPL